MSSRCLAGRRGSCFRTCADRTGAWRGVGCVGLGLEGVPGVEALERYVQVLQRRGDEEQARGQRHVQGLRHVEAPLGDLVAALDQERRRAQRECQHRRPGEHLIPQHAGKQQLAAAGGERVLAQVDAEDA